MPCDSSCSTCTGPSSSECQSCNTPFKLEGTSCICPNYTYFEVAKNTCSPCYGTCSLCSGPTEADCCSVSNCMTCDTTSFSTPRCTECLSGFILFQGTCVDSCPLTYFRNTTTKSCEDCYIGCDTCTAKDISSCTSCSNGYFLYNGSCIEHCPFNSYVSGRTCHPCNSSCVTCSGPSDRECTLCSGSALLLAGSCVDLCPVEYYQEGIDTEGSTLVPKCSQKQNLSISLNLTADPRIIKIKFNFSVSRIISLLPKLLSITVGNVELSPDLYEVKLVSDSIAEIGLRTDMHIQAQTQMSTALNLNADFDTSQYNEYKMPQKNAIIELQEIYPFTPAEKTFIKTGVSIFNLTSTAGVTQVVQTFLSSGLSTSIVRFKLLVDTMQALRFVPVNWPPMVQDFYAGADIYPSQLVIPITFFPEPPSYELRNISVSQTLQTLEITPEFLYNYGHETSNLVIYFSIALIAHLLNRLIEYKYKYSYKRKPKILVLVQLFDMSFAWRFFLVFYLSIFDTTYLYSLIQLCYPSFSTPYVQSSMVLAIAYLIGNLSLLAWVALTVRKLTKTEDEELKTNILKHSRTSCLLNDYKQGNRLQPYYVPFFMLRDTLFSIVLVSLQVIPILQVICIALIFLLFLIYIVVCRPFEDRVELGLTIINESLRLSGCLCALILAFLDAAKSDSPDLRNGLGWTFLGINFAFILVLIIISLNQVIRMLQDGFRVLRRLFGKKEKIVPNKGEPIRKKSTGEEEVKGPKLIFRVDNTARGNFLQIDLC